jgi:hypothetical protein
MDTHPVTLRVTDDLRRTRLTVAFRIILYIPHLIWLALWGIAAFFAVIGLWFGALFTGRPPEGLHRFVTRYLRYTTHTSAYISLLADPYPGFMGDTEYPIDLEVAPPGPQSRLVTAFRLILAIPALIVQYILGILTNVLALIAWFIALFTAKVPEGLRNLGLFCLRFSIQTSAYISILTERYPSFAYDAPAPAEPSEPATRL